MNTNLAAKATRLRRPGTALVNILSYQTFKSKSILTAQRMMIYVRMIVKIAAKAKRLRGLELLWLKFYYILSSFQIINHLSIKKSTNLTISNYVEITVANFQKSESNRTLIKMNNTEK